MVVMRLINNSSAPTRPSSSRREAYWFWMICLGEVMSGKVWARAVPAEPRPVPMRRLAGSLSQRSRARLVRRTRTLVDSGT